MFNSSKTLLAVTLAAFAMPAMAEHASERLKEASEVVQELMNAGDKGIPQELLDSIDSEIKDADPDAFSDEFQEDLKRLRTA